MLLCPRCGVEMVWQNDYDLGFSDDDATYTDYLCDCGVMVTVPWDVGGEENEDEEEG